MNNQTVKLATVFIFLMLITLPLGSALTGKIGNGRMILTVEMGEKIERSVLVINDNDVPVNVTVSAAGDLEEDLEIVDDNFQLEPGEQKKAYFTWTADKLGGHNTNINVQFAPLVEGENGVGISATVFIRVLGEGDLEQNIEEEPEFEETGNDEGLEEEESFMESEETGDNTIDGDNENSEMPIEWFLGASTIILAAVFLGLIYFMSIADKNTKKKSVKKGGNKSKNVRKKK